MNQSLELSIVVPCYNCEDTLRDSIASCYRQGLNSFEILLVDDGSTDGTRAVMNDLAQTYSEVRVLFHEKNKGGGAARNTGIRASEGKVLYCLDSDNIFADDSIVPMIEYMKSENIDGVAFHERRFFLGNNRARFTSHFNTVLNRTVTLTDLFNDTHTLLDNFFYTREAYDTTPGYPEHHGFDTQAFEVRFLASENRIRIFPTSVFYHRQGLGERSYFERVYASGLFSVNYSLIFEDMLPLLSAGTIEALFTFPLFTHNKTGEDNLLELLRARVMSGQERFTGIDTANDPTPYRSFITALEFLNHADPEGATALFQRYIESEGSTTPYVSFVWLRILNGLAGVPYNQQVAQTLASLQELTPIRRPPPPALIQAFARTYPSLFKAINHFRKL